MISLERRRSTSRLVGNVVVIVRPEVLCSAGLSMRADGVTRRRRGGDGAGSHVQQVPVQFVILQVYAGRRRPSVH